MSQTSDVFITSLGAFLPGAPINNDQIEDYLGRIHGRPSRAKARVLKQNGILTRHYALNDSQQTTHRASEMAALAAQVALSRSTVGAKDIDFLAAATTQGDLCVPGFASMVHGEMVDLSTCEIASLHGVCGSGVMALRSAGLAIKAGERHAAIACAAELPSRLFKASRWEGRLAPGASLPFETEFLRWMLSDGAGAAILQPRPAERGLSLKIEWIDIRSHAHSHPTCMLAGANHLEDGTLGPSWLDYPSFEDAAAAGAIDLKQDIRLLDRMVKIGVDGLLRLIEQGRLNLSDVDWIACHHSSRFFHDKIVDSLSRAGVTLAQERWFTNLYGKGNVGSASAFVLLEELFNGGKLRAGQKVFLMVPESGRFLACYALFTVVGKSDGGAEPQEEAPISISSDAGPPILELPDLPLAQSLLRQLTRVWLNFEEQLHGVPIIKKMESGRLTVGDYQALLMNMRQQVVEGARWISRAASNLDADLFPLRSLFIAHAKDEHRDFEMLERDYVATGGALDHIRSGQKNIGSEALSAFMFHKASRENPLDLLGAMFIIEGLGARLANKWGRKICEQLGLPEKHASFLLYHGKNDENHLERLEQALGSGVLTPALVDAIVKTARVTARLYRLQLEELGEV